MSNVTEKDSVDNIYSFITSEEGAYSLPIPVGVDGYEWNMQEHIRTTVLYKASKFTKGPNDGNRPFKNIIRGILNLQYRTEGFDVKEILLYINNSTKYFLSFLVRKYHEDWARENSIDTFIDDVVESYVDFGGTLVQKTKDIVPKVIKPETIAFCDQSNILSSPFGIRHFMSPSELKDMETNGWGDKKFGASITVEDLIIVSKKEKKTGKVGGKAFSTPGKYLEVYEVHGYLPESYLKEDGAVDKFIPQIQFVTFYTDEKGEKQWNTLFKANEPELKFKFLKRGKDFGRAFGFGGAEELFQPQIWVNFSEIAKKEMLEAASKVIHVTDDPSFPTQNKVSDLDNGEILTLKQGRKISVLDTRPLNIELFDRATLAWETNARQLGAASETSLGAHPPSGTPFKLEQLVSRQTVGEESLHGYRQGQIATFVDELYRDWFIPGFVKDITKGKEFLAKLELDELQTIADNLVKTKVEEFKKEQTLEGKLFGETDIESIREKVRADFMSGGSDRFLKIFKDEMKEVPISVKTNIAGKQKDMLARVDKLNSVFSQVFSTYDPQTGTFTALDDPRIAKLFNEILENSDLSPIDFNVGPQQAAPRQTPLPKQPLEVTA